MSIFDPNTGKNNLAVRMETTHYVALFKPNVWVWPYFILDKMIPDLPWTTVDFYSTAESLRNQQNCLRTE